MIRPRAVIAEDEPMLLGQLREALARPWPELDVVAEAEDGVQAIQALHQHHPDVIFLDIQMPGMSGLEVAKVASGRCHVVFVTAYDQYVVAAFEHGAVDYLMKPWSAARLAAAIARLRERAGAEPARLEQSLLRLAHPGKTAQYLRWISVAVGSTTQLITCDEICYFQADNKYTIVVTPSSQPLINRTIRQFVAELDPNAFVQIHRSTLVNINAIAAIDRNLRGGLSVRLKQRSERLPVSATHAHVFRHM